MQTPPTNIGPGIQMVLGSVAFVTTAGTAQIPCPFRTVLGIVLEAIGTPASDENLSINNTIVNDTIANPPGGALTLTRTGAAKTSGLVVMYQIFGR